ncbi:MAG: PRC-barrel domain-containing protein [Anaerolineales bacterium]|nr:PRC-barrel domain-containing protein [Anaerolineales bacterium]
MLRSMNELLGYQVMARDGEMGKVADFYFDDQEWMTRYLVVDTGPWIFGRKVLVSILALGQPVWSAETFPVELTREQVKNSPDIDLAKPVSRQQQVTLHDYYRWPAYWSLPISAQRRPMMTPVPNVSSETQDATQKEAYQENQHLRSLTEVLGYEVLAEDGPVGQVADFIASDEDWAVRYLVVALAGTESNRKVLLAPAWIRWIRQDVGQVQVELSQEIIRESPEFDFQEAVNRQYEEVLYDYYGRPKYWRKLE